MISGCWEELQLCGRPRLWSEIDNDDDNDDNDDSDDDDDDDELE